MRRLGKNGLSLLFRLPWDQIECPLLSIIESIPSNYDRRRETPATRGGRKGNHLVRRMAEISLFEELRARSESSSCGLEVNELADEVSENCENRTILLVKIKIPKKSLFLTQLY